jgi:CRISPR-associated protein Csd1
VWNRKWADWKADMSWIQKLYDTYEQCAGTPQSAEADRALLPICHITQNAHIEIAVDGQGNFLRATVLPKIKTILPATEKSMTGRTSGVAPYPLSEKIQYCAKDYPKHGGKKKSHFSAYSALLSSWCESSFSHPKVKAVSAYVGKGTVVADLVREKILYIGDDGFLLTSWPADIPAPALFKNLAKSGSIQDQGDAMVRWRVEVPGDPVSATWDDKSLMDAWIRFDTGRESARGLCLVVGKETTLAKLHPSRLRHGGDGAKLISSNDTSGFTFRGRFIDADQACGVGFDVTHKAHNALRWLIARQAYQSGDQTIVAWAVSGKRIPDPFKNSHELFGIETVPPEVEPVFQGDAGQAFGRRLARLIAGYRAGLGSTNEIVVMGLDSATDGRLAITFYRELAGSEFLERVQSWHGSVAWHQHYSKEISFVGAPSPREIAEAAYGRRLDDKLRKATVERLLPCIIDGQTIPRDLMESTIRRACNRAGLEPWEWEKNLGIACALFTGYFAERRYQMALEPNRTTRDYLYGRLLAIAEHIEGRALHVAGEKRETNAGKLMQRFADRPYSTWRTIELSLGPYKTRLRAKRPSFLNEMGRQLDEVIGAFQEQDFTDERRLTGEFLLGYHCQRQALWAKPENGTDEEANDS